MHRVPAPSPDCLLSLTRLCKWTPISEFFARLSMTAFQFLIKQENVWVDAKNTFLQTYPDR